MVLLQLVERRLFLLEHKLSPPSLVLVAVAGPLALVGPEAEAAAAVRQEVI